MVQTFSGSFIDARRNKKTSADLKNLGLAFGQLFPRQRLITKRAIGYIFNTAQRLLSNRLWLCGVMWRKKTRAEKKIWEIS